MLVETCGRDALQDWIALRRALWPHALARHELETANMLNRAGDAVAFLARTAGRAAVGFAEVTVRRDYVNGCAISPVAFLEGIYVHPDWRKRGVARLLCAAVEDWVLGAGCTELASDTDLRNVSSQQAHAALGFAETERVVFYRKALVRRG